VDQGQWLPYVLGGGGITALLAALRWGRQDARDSVEASASNTNVAMSLRDAAIAENERLKSQIMALVVENTRLTRIMIDAGIDPHPPDPPGEARP
jgi:hypothetical protein